jgi:putative membrane protein
MKAILTDEERAKIAAKIAEVEQTTAGEIVVHTVLRSESYREARWLMASLITYGVVLSSAFLFPDEPARWAVASLLPVFLLAWWISAPGWILRRMVPEPVMADAVHRRAELAFLENNVHRTRDQSGVLIFVSALEHRVEILADEGIHQRVGVEGWKKYVQVVVSGIRDGKAGDGIVNAIEGIGAELKQHFPPRDDDTNELNDAAVLTQN